MEVIYKVITHKINKRIPTQFYANQYRKNGLKAASSHYKNKFAIEPPSNSTAFTKLKYLQPLVLPASINLNHLFINVYIHPLSRAR